MKRIKILISLLIITAIFTGGKNNNTVETPSGTKTDSKDIVVLYTNDVHCAFYGDIGYDGLSAYKKKLESESNHVFLVDNGDAVSGHLLDKLADGRSIVHLMNKTGYDVAIPGNHEFDNGAQNYIDLTKLMEFPVICCNFYDLRTGRTVFEPYIIKKAGDKKIAFVGVITPYPTTGSRAYLFQDEDKQPAYSFRGGKKDDEIYEEVQSAVNAANTKGADYTVLLSHLGINKNHSKYTSKDVIEHTDGIDAVLDAHSHSIVEMELVKNKNGENVILSQTGSRLKNIGKLTIGSDGKMKTELIGEFTEKDPDVTKTIDNIRTLTKEKYRNSILTTD